MKKTILITALALVIIMLLGACAQSAPSTGTVPAPTPAPAPPGFSNSEDKGTGGATMPSAGVERRIVRTGNLLLVVTNVLNTRDSIADMAQRLGGYVVSSNVSGEMENVRAYISIR